jgi:hypothetical protein
MRAVDHFLMRVFGRLSPRALGLVIEWATVHQQELLADWRRAEGQSPLEKIEPLQ